MAATREGIKEISKLLMVILDLWSNGEITLDHLRCFLNLKKVGRDRLLAETGDLEIKASQLETGDVIIFRPGKPQGLGSRWEVWRKGLISRLVFDDGCRPEISSSGASDEEAFSSILNNLPKSLLHPLVSHRLSLPPGFLAEESLGPGDLFVTVM